MADQQLAPEAGWPVLDVLTRSGAARDAFLASLGDEVDVDARLVSDVVRATGRVSDTLATRRALVELCGVLRILDAAEATRIDLDELRAGLSVHAARTDSFAGFHEARVLLRTLSEVLDGGRTAAPTQRAVRGQLELLHRELRSWLVTELTGDVDGVVSAARSPEGGADPRAAWRIAEPGRRHLAHDLVEGLLHGVRDHPVTGLLGAAWVRGWDAVPVAGDRLGDDPAELRRLQQAVAGLPTAEVLQVRRARAARWHLRGSDVVVDDALRPAWSLPATPAGFAAASADRLGAAILTTWDEQFAYVEADTHHLVLGPGPFVEAVVGRPKLEAIAAFREYVEGLAVDGEDPPADLLEVATSCGRLRRRAR